MKKGSTIFLQCVIVLIGIGVLAFLLLEPLYEGRNVNAMLFQVYFHDWFLAYAYTASIAFFTALYQAFRLLGYIAQNKVFSMDSVRALRAIKYCALIIVAFLAAGVGYLVMFMRGQDDIAGGVAMALMISFLCIVTATAAAVFEKLLQSAVELKSENDLTV